MKSQEDAVAALAGTEGQQHNGLSDSNLLQNTYVGKAQRGLTIHIVVNPSERARELVDACLAAGWSVSIGRIGQAVPRQAQAIVIFLLEQQLSQCLNDIQQLAKLPDAPCIMACIDSSTDPCLLNIARAMGAQQFLLPQDCVSDAVLLLRRRLHERM
jgi:hypothetical protein